MSYSTTGSCGPCSTTGIPVQSLRFIPSADNKYIGIYAQNKCNEWVPVNIGLTSVPSLQQVRDVDRNISLSTGSYTDAHFYLRSADGNNVNTAFFTNKDGGGIQSGNSTGAYVPLNLQPLGGLLNYGGSEVATKVWTQGQGYLKTETDPTVPSFVKAILQTDITNWNGKENTANKSTAATLGTSDILFPTQKAVKTYVDTSITTNNANYIPLTQKGVANGVATLGADGKILTAQVPSIAISDTFVVASQAAMLALSAAQTGDIAVRTDVSQSFILTNNTPGTLSSWQQLLSPTVSSTDQVPEGSTNLYFTPARARGAVSVTGNGSYNATTGVITVNAETDPVYTASVPNQLMVKATIPTAADLNTYQTTGVYLQPANANAAAGTNYPIALAGKLEVVFASASMIWQTYHVYGDATASNRAIWRREYYAGSWTPWVKLIDATSGAAYELVANKATSFSTVNNTTYPTTLAVTNLSYNSNQIGRISLSNNADITKIDASPIMSGGMSDTLAFRVPVVAETSGDWGATWTNVATSSYTGITSQRTKYTAGTSQILLTNTSGSITSVRLTYAGIANMFPSWLKYVSGFVSPSVNFIITLETSSDNSTYTVAGTYTAQTQSIGGCWIKIQNVLPNGNNYVRITVNADSTGTTTAQQSISQIQLLTYRQDYNNGIEANYPFSWSNEKYLTVTSPTTTTQTGYDMALLSGAGQITRGSFANMLSTTGIQNQQATAQTANFWISGNGTVGALGIGGAPTSGIGVRFVANLTGGSANPAAFYINSTIQSDATGSVLGYSTFINTAAAAFTTSQLYHFIARQGTIGSGSAISQQYGFYVQSTLTGAASNYGFRSDIPASTNNWNLYMFGTAPNYLNGRLAIGTTNTNSNIHLSLPMTGSATFYNVSIDSLIQTDVTSYASYYRTAMQTAINTVIASASHFEAQQGSFGTGTAMTNQYGFVATSGLIGATNNYGFVGQLSAATGRWNMYMSGTAQNWFAGNVGIGAGLSTPIYPFMVTLGTSTVTTPIAQFGQNGGTIQIANQTSAASAYLPAIRGTAVGQTYGGLYFVGQGADSFTNGAFFFSARNAAGTAATTGGKIFSVNNYTTEYLSVDFQGIVNIPNLAGTGTRIVTTSATGVLGSITNNFATHADLTLTATVNANPNLGFSVGLAGGNTIGIPAVRILSGPSSDWNTIPRNMAGYMYDGASNAPSFGQPYGTTYSSFFSFGHLDDYPSGIIALGSNPYDTNGDFLFWKKNYEGGSSASHWYQAASREWVLANIATNNLQAVASAGNTYLGDLVLGTSGNQIFVGSGTVGSSNTRLGAFTLSAATSGNWNTAIGSAALGALIGSDNNTAVGEGALFAYKGVTSSGANSAFGDGAGSNMTEGNDNLFLGVAAGSVGGSPMVGGDLNVFIGRSAGNFFGVSTSVTIGSRNIYIGQNAGYGPAYAPLSDKLLIGNNPTPGTSVHIIEGSMVPGAQSLKFNAMVAVSSLAGTGSRMVIADTAGNLSTQAIPAGTLTGFSAGALSPLFTTSVATATTTPALTFALTAAAANTYFGNNTAASTSPSYTTMAALTAANDTNVTISLGGTPATSLFKAVSLTMGWTGTLSVARGGTGAGSLTGYVKGNGTNAFTAVTTIPFTDISGYSIPTLQQVTTAGNSSSNVVYFSNNVFFGNTNQLLIDSSGCLSPNTTAFRAAGLYGIYDSTKASHIWGIGTAYKIASDGSTLGGTTGSGLYGMAYLYQTHANSPVNTLGHQVTFVGSGTVNASISISGGQIYSRPLVGTGTRLMYADATGVMQALPTANPQLNTLGIVHGGAFDGTPTTLAALSGYSSFMGSFNSPTDSPLGATTQYWNVISTRHRNGTGDGNTYGMQMASQMTGYSSDPGLWYRAQLSGTWGSWYQVTTGGNGAYLQNQYASGQSFNGWINGNLKATNFVFQNGSYFTAFSSGQIYLLDSVDNAQSLKVGGLTISNTYSDAAPTNGLFAKGASYLVGGTYTNALSTYTGTNINVMSSGQTFTVNAAMYGVGGVYTNSLLPYSGTALTIGATSSSITANGNFILPALAGSVTKMLVIDTAGKVNTATLPGNAPQGAVTLSSSTGTITLTDADATGSTEKFGRISIVNNTAAPITNVEVFITYNSAYPTQDAKATISPSNKDAALIEQNGFYHYINKNDRTGFSILFSTLSVKVPLVFDYNVVGY